MVNKRKDFKKWALLEIKKAILDYYMIQNGDKVLVGLSGGKDSGVLLYALNILRKISPIKFELYAAFLDLGFGMDVEPLEKMCQEWKIPFYKVVTDIKEIIFDVRKEKNPCSLCANLRRGALNGFAVELGCKKVALGHHLDDVVETFFMSLFYTGQFKTFDPNTYLDRRDLYMIRPLVYLGQESVKELAQIANIPIITNLCPANGNTKREEIKEVIKFLENTYGDLRYKVLNALKNTDLDNLWLDKKEYKGL